MRAFPLMVQKVAILLRGLYAVTPDQADTLCLLEQVAKLHAGGGRWLQYRNKAASPSLRKTQAAQLAEFCKLCGMQLIINDDLDLAISVGADGVHLGGDDCALSDLQAARRRLGPERVLGVSCYDEVDRAVAAAAAGADYVAMGAMFASRTKPEARHASLDLLREAKVRTNIALVAIGGITLANAPQVIQAGADMLAVITDLFDAPDIAIRAQEYQQLFD